MKIFRFLSIDSYRDSLFNYPCIDSNGDVFCNKKICIFDNSDIINERIFEGTNAIVLKNPNDTECSLTNVGIITPIFVRSDDENSYFEILDYYIKKLQLLIHKQRWMPDFKHIVVVLPKDSDRHSTSLNQMAYYAIYGFIKGLGKTYAPDGIYINGVILSDDNQRFDLWIKHLSSDNANNIVGQVFKI